MHHALSAQPGTLRAHLLWTAGQIGSGQPRRIVIYSTREQSTRPVTSPATRAPDRDTAFARDALPWLDDVFRFARSLTHDEADADDIVQDTYLRAYRSWHTFVPGTDCRRWLFTICRNAFLRSRERIQPTVDLDGPELEALASGSVFAAAMQEGREDLFTRLDLRPAIEAALLRVPEPFRTAVVLVDLEDQPYEAAAAILQVPIGTIRSRLFRGRRLMQELLLVHARDAGLAAGRNDAIVPSHGEVAPPPANG